MFDRQLASITIYNNRYLSWMSNQELYRKIEALPNELKQEVAQYIAYLETKASASKKKNRQAGLAKGLISIKDGFDDPLEDFKPYMP